MLPAVPSLAAVASGVPEYAVANAKGLSASCPATTESLDSAYLTLNVWICPTGPLIGCTPSNSLAINEGITLLIRGNITLFKEAMFPLIVEPADAASCN